MNGDHRCLYLLVSPSEHSVGKFRSFAKSTISTACAWPSLVVMVFIPALCDWSASSTPFRELVSEHRIAAFGLRLRGLILDHVPVLDEKAVLDSQNVRRDPVYWQAEV